MYSKLFLFILLCLIHQFSTLKTTLDDVNNSLNDTGMRDIYADIKNATNNFDLLVFNPVMEALKPSNDVNSYRDLDKKIRHITEQVIKRRNHIVKSRVKRSTTNIKTENFTNVTVGQRSLNSRDVTLSNRSMFGFLGNDFVKFGRYVDNSKGGRIIEGDIEKVNLNLNHDRQKSPFRKYGKSRRHGKHRGVSRKHIHNKHSILPVLVLPIHHIGIHREQIKDSKISEYITEHPITEDVSTEDNLTEGITTENVPTDGPLTEDSTTDYETFPTEDLITEDVSTEIPVDEILSTDNSETEYVSTEDPTTEGLPSYYSDVEDVSTEGPVHEILTTDFYETEDVSTEDPVAENLTTDSSETEDVSTEDLTNDNSEAENVTTEEVPTEDLATEDLTNDNSEAENVTTEEVPTEDLATEDLKNDNSETESVTTEEVSTEDHATEDLTNDNSESESVTTEEVPTEDLTTEDLTNDNSEAENVTTEKVPTEDLATEDLTNDNSETESVTKEEVSTEDLATEDLTNDNSETESVTTEEVPTEDHATEDLINDTSESESVTTEDVSTDLATEYPKNQLLTAQKPLTSVPIYKSSATNGNQSETKSLCKLPSNEEIGLKVKPFVLLEQYIEDLHNYSTYVFNTLDTKSIKCVINQILYRIFNIEDLIKGAFQMEISVLEDLVLRFQVKSNTEEVGITIEQYVIETFNNILTAQKEGKDAVVTLYYILERGDIGNDLKHDIYLFLQKYDEMVSKESEIFSKLIKKYNDNHGGRSFYIPIKPGGLIQDKTFTILEGVYQGIVVPESELEIKPEKPSWVEPYVRPVKWIPSSFKSFVSSLDKLPCTKTCADFKENVRQITNNETENSLQEKTILKEFINPSLLGQNPGSPKCNGVLSECQFLAKTVTTCNTKNNPHRLYNSVTIEGEPIAKNCDFVQTFRSWRTPQPFSNECDPCFCMCSRESNSLDDFYFSTFPVQTIVDENRVITGVKLSKTKQTVHFDIQDAALNIWGGIDRSTYKWRKGNVLEKDRVAWFTKYMKVAPIETSGPEWFITGVRFIDDKKNRLVGHEIQETFYNRILGVLDPYTSRWKGSDGGIETIKSFEGAYIPRPEYNYTYNKLNTEPFVFRFDHSCREDDAAQSIVPFIDIRPIFINTSFVPLSGIELRYLTDELETTSGFLTLSLKTQSAFNYIKNISNST